MWTFHSDRFLDICVHPVTCRFLLIIIQYWLLKLYSHDGSKIANTRVSSRRIFGDYATGRLKLRVILTCQNPNPRLQLWLEMCQCASLCQVIPVVTNSLGKTVRTSEKFWTILKKLKNFCEKFQKIFHAYFPAWNFFIV